MQAKFLVLAAVVLVLGAAGGNEAEKQDLKKFQGAWVPASVRYEGKDISTKFKLVFKGNKGTVEGDDELKKEYASFTLKFDPSTMPKCVDITIGGGVQKGVVMEGIYEFKGDELKLCVKVIGKERPNQFAAPDGSSTCLLVLKREP